MTREEPTNEARIRRVISDEIQLPRTGVITKVYEHVDEEDPWNFHVDVRIGPDDHPRKVPVATGTPDLISPPRTQDHPDGPDLALVQYLDDAETERPIVSDILYSRENRPPLGSEGIYRLRRGSLYVEAGPQGEWVRLAKKPGDEQPADSKIELDSDGNATIGGDDTTVSIGSAPRVQLYQSGALESGGGSPFDWNNAGWTNVPWDGEETNADAFATQTSQTGDSYIQVQEDGIYEITVHGIFSTADNGLRIAQRITKNGNSLGSINVGGGSTGGGAQVPGALNVSPVAGHTSGDNNMSTEFSVELELAANDTIRVQTQARTNAGSLFPIGTHTFFRIDQRWTSE